MTALGWTDECDHAWCVTFFCLSECASHRRSRKRSLTTLSWRPYYARLQRTVSEEVGASPPDSVVLHFFSSHDRPLGAPGVPAPAPVAFWLVWGLVRVISSWTATGSGLLSSHLELSVAICSAERDGKGIAYRQSKAGCGVSSHT